MYENEMIKCKLIKELCYVCDRIPSVSIECLRESVITFKKSSRQLKYSILDLA